MTKTSSAIWRTVVVAGAMLGTTACHHDHAAATTPAPTTLEAAPADESTELVAPVEGHGPPPEELAEKLDSPPQQGAAATVEADPVTATPAVDSTPATPVAAKPKPKQPRPRGGGTGKPQGRGFVLA